LIFGRGGFRLAVFMDSPEEATPEISFLKALLFSAGYFALLFPSLIFALTTNMDLADPPVINPNADHSFLLSGAGEWLWFGAAFTLPALMLLAASYLLRRVWKGPVESK
jgi:hypothetical protein